MAKIDNGGPAFPVLDLSKTQERGLSLRDWFAGQALAALIAKAPLTCTGENDPLGGLPITQNQADEIAESMAVSAYEYADAMIAASRKETAE